MKIAILGSTGSIGRQTADVAAFQGYEVEAICAAKSIDVLEEQIRRFSPKYCGVFDHDAAKQLQLRVKDTKTKLFAGEQGILDMISLLTCDTVVNAIVGKAGLLPTLAVLEKGITLALANKESLVCAGDLVMAKAKEKGVSILPVDSEHSAIFQCLHAGRREDLNKILLTASGGPFFGKTKEELEHCTLEMTLAHPTWQMGSKITVDSATLMNKGFEVIEAIYLFDLKPSQVEVLVHRQSIVHSMVEFADHSVIAQMSVPDMRDCIQYALTYPKRVPSPVDALDLTKIGALTFQKPDTHAFPLLPLALRAIGEGGVRPAALNAANEAAVALFLAGKIRFTRIAELVTAAVDAAEVKKNPTLSDILHASEVAFDYVNEAANRG